jgi:hypothetical protein
MKKFYITSIGYNVLYEELDQTLCVSKDGKTVRWAQPYFERFFEELLFDTEYEALNHLQTMYPDRKLTVLEDTGKVLSTWAHETGLTSMVIRQERND